MSHDSNPLLRVCKLLNDQKAEYLVIGGWAMILNSVVRATEDVDILIADHDTNFQKVIHALSQLADGAARELVPNDFKENIVIKIADEVEVDVSTQAWTVRYSEAVTNALSKEVEGVLVPFLSIEDLIRSKQTHRDQDRIDVEMLRRLLS
jgi:folate-dependent phosphoribosylglycinamide formyltransferase PurN